MGDGYKRYHKLTISGYSANLIVRCNFNLHSSFVVFLALKIKPVAKIGNTAGLVAHLSYLHALDKKLVICLIKKRVR